MKISRLFLFALFLLAITTAQAQNIGIGTETPLEKLDINGKVRTNGIILNNGGSPFDYLMKSNVNGEVGFKKATGGVGIGYIICISGNFPLPGLPTPPPFLGEIRMFSGGFTPYGWVACNGQLMVINQHPSLFSILGTTYGGDGQTTFALPDLRGAVPIGTGVTNAGYQWTRGEKTY